jgi:hypothetical protein
MHRIGELDDWKLNLVIDGDFVDGNPKVSDDSQHGVVPRLDFFAVEVKIADLEMDHAASLEAGGTNRAAGTDQL